MMQFSLGGRSIRTATLLLFALGLTASLWGYEPQTLERMTDASLRLAPAALKNTLQGYRSELEAGIREGLAVDRDTIPLAADTIRETLPAMARDQVEFERIARGFGRLAGLMFRYHDPLAEQGGRLGEVRSDYYRYVERILPRLILIFDGYWNPPLVGSVNEYLRKRARLQERYRSALLQAYFPEGKRVSSNTFDDLSNAFGAAQGILSHAVSDTAKAWFLIWKEMNGDLSATPYYRPRPSPKKESP